MEPTTAAKLISDYGLAIVIAAIFLITYLKNEKSRSRRADANAKQRKKEMDERDKQFQTILENQIDQINNLNNLVSSLVKKSTSGITKNDEMLLSQIDNQIDTVLNRLREITGAGRVLLVRYHNGNKDFAGNSFIKMSCTNERVMQGISPFRGQFQNQFRTLVSHLCNDLVEKGYFYCHSIEELKEEKHYTMYEFFNTRNIVCCSAYPVKDNDGFILGFVLMEYLVNCPIWDQIKDPLRIAAKEISTLLSLKAGGS